jgi:hypothetical protein
VVGCRFLHNSWPVREEIRRLASEVRQVEYLGADEALRALHLWRACAAMMAKREARLFT